MRRFFRRVSRKIKKKALVGNPWILGGSIVPPEGEFTRQSDTPGRCDYRAQRLATPAQLNDCGLPRGAPFYFDNRSRSAIQLGRPFFHSIPVARTSAKGASVRSAGRRIFPDTMLPRQPSEKLFNDITPGRLWQTKQL